VKPNIVVPGILECPSLCPANSYAAGIPLRKYTFRTKGPLPAYSYVLRYPGRYFKPLVEMQTHSVDIKGLNAELRGLD
jgi:hypothetical protein